MRRLERGQVVTLELDGDPAGFACSVDAVAGSIATLTRRSEGEPRVLRKLASGALGFLVFAHQSAAIALRGVARIDPARANVVDFVVTDGVQIAERRLGERTAAVVRATIAGGEPRWGPLETETVNLSVSGALLRDPGAEVARGDIIAVEIDPGGDAPAMGAQARVVRRSKARLAIRFVELSDEDELRLAGFLEATRVMRPLNGC